MKKTYTFLKELNGFHPSIKFTFGKLKAKVNFFSCSHKNQEWEIKHRPLL